MQRFYLQALPKGTHKSNVQIVPLAGKRRSQILTPKNTSVVLDRRLIIVNRTMYLAHVIIARECLAGILVKDESTNG